MKTTPTAFLLALCASLPLAADAELKLPAIIGDNMVLQQKQDDPIWGWDKPETKVTVTFGGKSVTGSADSKGKWTVKINPGAANANPQTLTIKGSETKELKNILVGEVWICSGQSNMQFSVNSSTDADLEMATAKFPKIHLITVPNVGTQEPQDDFKGSWAECSPQTVGGFSAAGYCFGRSIHQIVGVPVGLINNSWGGSAAEAWVRRDVLENDKRFADLMKRTVDNETNLTKGDVKAKFDAALAAWQKRAADAKKEGKPFMERAPGNPTSWLTGNARPGNIYNGVLRPTIGYGIKGAIWYQGESNAGRAYEYGYLFPRMIQHWREEWKQGDFPFYWVQLADFLAEPTEPGDSSWAELRESQTKTQAAVPNGGQAVIIDLGEGKDIHPKNKRDVGERLVRWALAKDYGIKVAFHSPEFKKLDVVGNKAVVTLDTFGSSLQTFDVKYIQGVAICGEDKKWVWADAKIVGADKIEATSPDVAEPVAVRYAWSNNPVCNLYNKELLPVTPFRSDNFEMTTKPKQ